MSHSELATSYAALILADDDVDITVSRRYWRSNIVVGSTDKFSTARQTANPHQSRQRRRCRGNMDNSFR